MAKLSNPFRPGAGLYPPYLAGRDKEIARCANLFEQSPVSRNIIITGLRGVGKTVLLAKLKDLAISKKWMWCGTDMSESASVSEYTVATRILTDLSVITSTIPLKGKTSYTGFNSTTVTETRLGFRELADIFDKTGGLVSDKLKATLSIVWEILRKQTDVRGIIFAYDEVQTMTDHAEDHEYPLSLLLDVFQSFQRREFPFLLILTGLPTLLPLLVTTRTYSERMFETVFLERLTDSDSRLAIEKPIKREQSQLGFSRESIDTIIKTSSGYPYFIQFICKEVFDSFIRQIEGGNPKPRVPIEEIVKKLDTDFFAGRWARLSDRQKDLLTVIASMKNCAEQFTTKDVVAKSKDLLEKPFGSSQVTQLFDVLQNKGITYRNRHGKYSFAVPLLDEFIRRQSEEDTGK